MKKLLSIKISTLLLICLTFLLTGAFGFNLKALAEENEKELTYSVVFMLDKDTHYETQEDIPYNGYASVPETPFQDGKIFEYWIDENGNPFSFRTPITNDITLTAYWEVKVVTYSVKFCVNGEIINEQIIKADSTEKVIAPVDFDCGEGKEFDYWDKSFDTVSEDLIVNAVLKNKKYTVTLYGFGKQELLTQEIEHGCDFDLPTIPTIPNNLYQGYSGKIENIVEDGKIYLNYSPVEYTVSFTVDGMPFETKQSESVKHGDTVNFPGVVSRLGHVFMGWFIDLESDEMFDFSTPITENIELKAKVVPVIEKYEVKFFDFDNKQYGGTQMVEKGKSAILPGNPYKEGYEFEGWQGNYSNITADTNIYPIFKIKTYNVKFFSENTLISEQDVNYGDSAVEPSFIPEKQGFEFIRWDKSFNQVSKNLEIYAVFEEKTFVVMFYSHEMKKIGATQFVKYGQSAIAPQPADREGYNFNGWNGDYTNVVEDIVFVAQYTPKVYTVDFYYQSQLVSSQNIAYGEYVDFYVYEIDGYLFYGWYLDDEFNQSFSFNTKVTENISLHAKLQQKPAETFTVTFKSEDGNIINVQVVEKGASSILPPAPTKEGFEFTCWTKESGEGALDKVQDNLVYIATYAKKLYKVIFCYGETIYDEQEVAHGQSAIAPTGITLTGHSFNGWDKKFEEVTGELIVNAIFEPNEYEVIFKYDLDGEIFQTQKVKYGQKASIPKAPQKDGYVFKKWQTIVDSNVVDFSFDTEIKGETIIFACFEGREYTVYYYIDGKIYHEQKVLFGEKIPEIDTPDYGNDYVFTGWSEIPDIMPAKNLSITGKMLKYFNLSFVVDGKEHHAERILEGSKINLPTPPKYDNIKYSFAWENVPSVMPAQDLIVYGKFTLISANIDNEIVLAVESSSGKTSISLFVRGNVNIGGVLVTIKIENIGNVTANLDENHADYNVKDNTITFVWAQGENLTEFSELVTFVVEGEQIEVNANSVSISTYAFNQDKVESVNGSLIIINR